MSRIHVPDTHGFISGRGSVNAGLALEAARAAGEPSWVVRATQGGYIVPLSVLDAYEAARAAERSEKPAAEEPATEAEVEPAAEEAVAKPKKSTKKDSAPAESDKK